MERKGHPILGAFGGLIFFTAITLLLLTTGTLDLGSVLVGILPLAGLVLGAIWGGIAPLGRNRLAPPGTPEASPPPL